MLQVCTQSLYVYERPIIAHYFCAMKRFLLITMGLTLWPSNTVFSQFNTITQGSVQQQTVPSKHLQCPNRQHRDSLAITPQQNKAEQTDRLPALVSPLRHIIVTSPFGWRTDPFTKRKARHNGLDLKAHYEPAYAMTYGEVVNIGKDKRSGLYVTLRHGDFTISYCHLSQATVTKGIHVCPGMIVAITGNSGSRSTGPHLHITVKYKGRTINPAVILKRFK